MRSDQHDIPQTFSPDGNRIVTWISPKITPRDGAIGTKSTPLEKALTHLTSRPGASDWRQRQTKVDCAARGITWGPAGGDHFPGRGHRAELLALGGDANMASLRADGHLLAAASVDGQVRVWDTREATSKHLARRFVRWLSPRCRDRAELLATIQNDRSLSEPVRRFALDIARRRPDPSPPRSPSESGPAAPQP